MTTGKWKPEMSKARTQVQSASQVLAAGINWLETHDYLGGPEAGRASEACNEVGVQCKAESPRARKWTPLGAIKRGMNDKFDDVVLAYSWLRLIVKERTGLKDLYTWNTQVGMNKERALEFMRMAFARAVAKEEEAAQLGQGQKQIA